MDIRQTLAAQSYAGIRETASVRQANGAEAVMGRLLDDFTATLDRTEETARLAMTGQADPHALVEALASSQTAVDTVVTIRDRVVEAYQEILRMPV
ncbi:MAG: flagellar hook-basal body complex protein FliE [Cypionkella sp.]|jgi:flagellar hook-basal body complex protein FliE|nr:flagellar hook-basal body complex protein FliE [Cypionkella sp.]